MIHFYKAGPRAKHAKDRDDLRVLCNASTSSDIMPTSTELEAAVRPELQTVVIGQQHETNYSVHKLPTCDESTNDNCSVTFNTALQAHVEMLEAENAKLKLQCEERKYFQIEFVVDNDNLVYFYTGFVSYKILISLDLLSNIFITGV